MTFYSNFVRIKLKFYIRLEVPKISGLLVGIDGGGTSTEFVLCDFKGRVKNRVQLGPSNPNDIGFEKSYDVLKNGLSELLNPWGGLSARIDGMFAGLSGGTVGSNRERFRTFFQILLPNARCENGSDAENAITLGLEEKDGITLISGTGSVAFFQRNGRIGRVGGWGYLFDRAGGGYNIGHDGIYAALLAYDGLGPTTLLTKKLEAAIGMPVHEALPDFYRRGKQYIASFAPVVFAACEEGDPAAVEIINHTAAYLSELLLAAYKRLEGSSKTVALVGGIFKRSDIMLPFMKNKLKVDFDFIIPSFPPIFGAVWKAAKIAGIDIDPEFKKNFNLSWQSS